MLGLIRKDLYVLKQSLFIYSIVAVVFALTWIPMKMEDGLIGMMTALGCVQVISLVSYDERSRWESFALSAPISRGMVVAERYLMMAVCTLAGGALGSAAVWLFSATAQAQGAEFLVNASVSVSLILIWGCVFLPFLIQYGAEKARLLMLGIVLVPGAVIMGAAKVVENYPHAVMTIKAAAERLFYLSPVLAAALILLSYCISLRLYKKKEF